MRSLFSVRLKALVVINYLRSLSNFSDNLLNGILVKYFNYILFREFTLGCVSYVKKKEENVFYIIISLINMIFTIHKIFYLSFGFS